MEKYQITKTIRFKLELAEGKAKGQNKLHLENLIKSLEDINKKFLNIFYFKDDDEKICVKHLFCPVLRYNDLKLLSYSKDIV